MSWTRKFVIRNISLLLSKDNRIDTITMSKKEYFHKNSLKSSEAFTLKELAFETLKYLIDIQRIRSEDDLRNFKESSAFLSDYVTEHDLEGLAGLLRPIQTAILKPEDLGKLGQDDYIKEKEQEFLQQARKIAEKELEEERRKVMEEVQIEREHLEELRTSVEKKLEEVRKMESLLDALPQTMDPEEYVSTEEERHKELPPSATWWQKIGLTGDPFPTKLGLDRIPENKYEQVVVETEIFRDYLKVIAEAPQTFYGKTILVGGQFGAGKTTFVQYIAYKLGAHKIVPFKLILDPIGDIDALRQNFYSALFAKICEAMRKRGLPDPRFQGFPVDRDTISDLLSTLSKESQLDGYIIMVDGLHKAKETEETPLEFVKQLQNFHEYLNDVGVNIGIFVTISPLWIRKITQNPAYSGSFHEIAEVPKLTFNSAYELLQKRLKAFSSPEIPVFFDRTAIQFAYSCLESELGNGITFRSFIDYILPRLQKGNLKEAGISVYIDIEVVRKIDRELYASAIKDSYAHLKDLTRGKYKLRRACSIALRKVYKKYHVEENDQDFRTNKGAFFILRNAGLIQKAKVGGGVGWTISIDFLPVLEDLNEKGFPPTIVFQAMSIDPSQGAKLSERVDPGLESAQDFLATYESEWPEIVPYVKDFIEAHKKIIENVSGGATMPLCSDCRSALIKLIQCIQIVLGDKQAPAEWLRSTWLDMSVPAIIESVIEQESISETEALEYYQRYHQATKTIIEKLAQLLEVNRLVNVVSSKNGREEKQLLFNAASCFQHGDFDRAIEEINSAIERRVRVAFHLAFSLHFGSDYLRRLPAGSQERIQIVPNKGPLPLKRGVDQNLFYHLSRSEYADIVNEKSNWNNIFERMFSPRTREEVVEALRATFCLDDRKQHRDRPSYFREVREEIRQAIFKADWLLYYLAHVLRISANPDGFVDEMEGDFHKVRISFAGQEQTSSSYPWRIPISKEKEIAKRLTSMSKTVNFSDDIAVSTLFNGTIAEVFITIASLLRRKSLLVQDLPESRMYLRIIPHQLTPS